MSAYKIFKPALGGGKFHTFDLVGKATCGAFLVDQAVDAIHRQANATDKPHPILCKRCLEVK